MQESTSSHEGYGENPEHAKMSIAEKIADFDRQREELVASVSKLEKEPPTEKRAREIRALNVRILEVNNDQEGWMIDDIKINR